MFYTVDWVPVVPLLLSDYNVFQHCLLVVIANLYLVFTNSSFMTTGIKSI